MLTAAAEEYRNVATQAENIAKELEKSRKPNEDFVKKLHARHADLQRLQGVHKPAQNKDLMAKAKLLNKITGTKTDDPNLANLRTQLQQIDARILERDEKFLKPLHDVVNNLRSQT